MKVPYVLAALTFMLASSTSLARSEISRTCFIDMALLDLHGSDYSVDDLCDACGNKVTILIRCSVGSRYARQASLNPCLEQQPQVSLPFNSEDRVSAHWKAIRGTLHLLGPSQEGDSRWLPQSLCVIPTRQQGPEVRVIGCMSSIFTAMKPTPLQRGLQHNISVKVTLKMDQEVVDTVKQTIQPSLEAFTTFRVVGDVKATKFNFAIAQRCITQNQPQSVPTLTSFIRPLTTGDLVLPPTQQEIPLKQLDQTRVVTLNERRKREIASTDLKAHISTPSVEGFSLTGSPNKDLTTMMRDKPVRKADGATDSPSEKNSLDKENVTGDTTVTTAKTVEDNETKASARQQPSNISSGSVFSKDLGVTSHKGVQNADDKAAEENSDHRRSTGMVQADGTTKSKQPTTEDPALLKLSHGNSEPHEVSPYATPAQTSSLPSVSKVSKQDEMITTKMFTTTPLSKAAAMTEDVLENFNDDNSILTIPESTNSPFFDSLGNSADDTENNVTNDETNVSKVSNQGNKTSAVSNSAAADVSTATAVSLSQDNMNLNDEGNTTISLLVTTSTPVQPATLIKNDDTASDGTGASSSESTIPFSTFTTASTLRVQSDQPTVTSTVSYPTTTPLTTSGVGSTSEPEQTTTPNDYNTSAVTTENTPNTTNKPQTTVQTVNTDSAQTSPSSIPVSYPDTGKTTSATAPSSQAVLTTSPPPVERNTLEIGTEGNSSRLALNPEENEPQSNDTFWPIVAALVIGIPSIIVFGIAITVIHKRRLASPARLHPASMYPSL